MTLPGRWANRRKREDGGWIRGRQTMSTGPWLRHFGSTDHPTVEGVGCGLSPLSVPQSQIHSWYPPQKRWQWLASGQQPPLHPTPPPPQQYLAELLGAALPHGPGQASVTPTPTRPLKSHCKTKHNKELSQDPACLHNNRKYTSSPFRLFLMSAFGLAAKCLFWELRHHYFKRGSGVFNAPSHTHNTCAEKKRVKALWTRFCVQGTSAEMDIHKSNQMYSVDLVSTGTEFPWFVPCSMTVKTSQMVKTL